MLYIHIPFCRKKCSYCDFYSIAYSRNCASSYIDVLCSQLKELKGNFSTIYIGGGTPSVLDKRLLMKLLKSLRPFSKGVVEFTIEVNPESLDNDKLGLFVSEGVNRISIGVQSFFDDKLKQLDRLHSSRQAKDAVLKAKKCGIDNISIDLIFGVEKETLDDWQKELEIAVKLPLKHISTYALTYEKNTALWDRLKKGELIALDDEITSRMYQLAMDYLVRHNFYHYEVSNFSQAGFCCEHNLNYWDNKPYVGLGPSAVSYRGGVRAKNTSDLGDYVDRFKKREPLEVFAEKLAPQKRAKETAAIKIRTKAGINFKEFKEQTGVDFLSLQGPALEELIKSGYLRYCKRSGEKDGVCLTEKGFLFCDTVSASLL
ncbi:MAG: radical SAM family heme chaperone HemW [Candidatus Omnitrophota bacterium]|nr:MAG: radical SAM family heme chaperone HemW [Candidatus Omnitrophota bacterium]